MASTAPDDACQLSFHDAFQAELYGIVDTLPIPQGGLVLDVPCGNGFYSRRLAERLGPEEQLTAVDVSDQYLWCARAAVADSRTNVTVRKADAYKLPFADATFDLVWCAQSLISLDPDLAIREMFRVVKPDGIVAILEADEFHHVLLPWPAELEVALPAAVYAASVLKYGNGLKLAPSRKLRAALERAGFGLVCRVTHPFDRAAPFDRPTTAFLTNYFSYLRSFAYPLLPAPMQQIFDRVTDPDRSESMYRKPGIEVVCINAVYTARPRRFASSPVVCP